MLVSDYGDMVAWEPVIQRYVVRKHAFMTYVCNPVGVDK